MFERNHFDEFTSLLERLSENKTKSHRQTLAFSATLTLAHEPPSYVARRNKKGRIIIYGGFSNASF